jgi:hypothetical protein
VLYKIQIHLFSKFTTSTNRIWTKTYIMSFYSHYKAIIDKQNYW